MGEEEVFQLTKFMTDSLNLVANTSPVTRRISPINKDYCRRLAEKDPLDVLGEQILNQPKEIQPNYVGTPIEEFFRDSNVLITGGTGFVGKLLTQKLVRSIPHLGHIYLFIRPKRGQSPLERFNKLLEDPVFRRMRIEVPNYLKKISCIEGELEACDLGLSEPIRQLLCHRVNVVFHGAADVRFIEPLRVAIESNVLASLRVMQLAKQMKHLKSYVHVSTAYSQCVKRVIEENIKPMSINYKEMLLACDTLSDKELELETPRLLQGWPNTYTFSKSLCENMILEESDGMPICVFRPSVIWPTYKEPVRGWSDNLYGPTGIMVGSVLGLLHNFRMDPSLGLDLVPADYVVNAMIAAAVKAGTCRDVSQIPVFNFTASPGRPMRWKTVLDHGNCTQDIWPYSMAIWGYDFSMTPTYVVDEAFNLFYKLRGSIIDKMLILSGNKPRLMKIYQRIDAVKPSLHYFLSNTWEFQNDNVVDLWNNLTEEDKNRFHFDVRDVDIREHMLIGKLGMRYYYLKDPMESIPAATIKQNRMKWIHNSLKVATGIFILKLMVIVSRILPF